MRLVKNYLTLSSSLLLCACGGGQVADPIGVATTPSPDTKPPLTVVSGQMLADGSVYIRAVNPGAPGKTSLLRDGSIYVVTPQK